MCVVTYFAWCFLFNIREDLVLGLHDQTSGSLFHTGWNSEMIFQSTKHRWMQDFWKMGQRGVQTTRNTPPPGTGRKRFRKPAGRIQFVLKQKSYWICPLTKSHDVIKFMSLKTRRVPGFLTLCPTRGITKSSHRNLFLPKAPNIFRCINLNPKWPGLRLPLENDKLRNLWSGWKKSPE